MSCVQTGDTNSCLRKKQCPAHGEEITLSDNKQVQSCPTKEKTGGKAEKAKKPPLPPIVREVPDPPVPNRAHTEM